jgi:hypothetical protein
MRNTLYVSRIVVKNTRFFGESDPMGSVSGRSDPKGPPMGSVRPLVPALGSTEAVIKSRCTLISASEKPGMGRRRSHSRNK